MNIFLKYCPKCAKCCYDWTIFITFAEQTKIKDYLGKNYNNFSEVSKIPQEEWDKYAQYGHIYAFARNKKILQLRKNGRKCIFLNSKNLCSIYPVRPYICKLFPLWFDGDDPVFCIGRHICPIPDNELLSYMKLQHNQLREWILEYRKCIEDYLENI